MTFWNYIGEFFLFRWLFGSHKHNEPKRNLSDTSRSFGHKDIIGDNDTHTGFGRRHENRCKYHASSIPVQTLIEKGTDDLCRHWNSLTYVDLKTSEISVSIISIRR